MIKMNQIFFSQNQSNAFLFYDKIEKSIQNFIQIFDWIFPKLD